jgi:hypothetical protein
MTVQNALWELRRTDHGAKTQFPTNVGLLCVVPLNPSGHTAFGAHLCQ